MNVAQMLAIPNDLEKADVFRSLIQFVLVDSLSLVRYSEYPMDDTQQQVLDGEIVDTASVTPKDDTAGVLISLDQLIKSTIDSLDKAREEIKTHRSMLEDVFINDETFRQHAEVAKETAKVKGHTRQEILKRPSVAKLADKVKSLATEIKEKRVALSEYLLEYQRLAGVNEIEGNDGQTREIINEARVVKKAQMQK